MKKNWVQNGPTRTEEERVVRRFNQSGQSAKGKIRMDRDTYVVYDYSKEFPVTKLEHVSDKGAPEEGMGATKSVTSDFKMPKFPVLTMIINGPPSVDQKSNDMDLILNRSMNNAFLWKDGDFQYY
jgi:hypothetical protein